MGCGNFRTTGTTWFDPAHPPALAEADFFLAVVNSRFVMLGTDDPSVAYGELTPDLTDFVWWENAMYDHLRERSHDGEVQLSVKGVGEHSPVFGSFDKTTDPKTISFKIKPATDEDEKAAKEAKDNPVSMLTINASLALRIALRRLLYIDSEAEA